jgi:broad specificity phosphatase PhoE
MRIFVIRHGQTTSDVEDRYGGDYDDHLTELGISQVQNMAEEVKDFGIEVIFASPKIRTDETSKILAEKINAPIKMVDGFRERNNWGILTGMTKKEAMEKHPEIAGAKYEIRHSIEGSEDYDSFASRVVEAFNDVTKSGYETVAVVTHGGPIRRIFGDILEMEKNWQIGDCAWLEIDYKDGKGSLVRTERIKEE